jgi:predicted glycoside hydrolase/deacetylase ChbG (UPF0249 family)
MDKPQTRKICIVNGDDFGASSGINRGIVEAHTTGILTSASLMINMPDCEEAIELSAAHPEMSIGLHVNFTNEGDPVIDLTDVEAARTELNNQYELFVERMGRIPTHLDTHHNIHREPSLSPLFLEFAEDHDLLLREHSPVRYFSSFYGQWDGESHPEHISPRQLLKVLETEIRPGYTELACHPGYAGDFASGYSAEREIELRSLCSEEVRQRVTELGIELVSFSEVRTLLRLTQANLI